MIGRGGEAAVWHRLLVRQGGAALRFGLGAALGQAVVVDLVLLVGNLLAEAAGTAATPLRIIEHSETFPALTL